MKRMTAEITEREFDHIWELVGLQHIYEPDTGVWYWKYPQGINSDTPPIPNLNNFEIYCLPFAREKLLKQAEGGTYRYHAFMNQIAYAVAQKDMSLRDACFKVFNDYRLEGQFD